MAVALLSICSLGLTVSYLVLIISLCKHFKKQMKQEIMRLTLLFASFVIAYQLRFIYQLGLGSDYYKNLVVSMVTRWHIILILPLFWDITSILAILVLHFKSFRRKNQKIPKAGHFNEQSGMPTLETASALGDDYDYSSNRGSFVDFIDED